MSAWEKRVAQWCIDKKDILFWVVITCFAAVVRFEGRNFISTDMKVYLIKWYEEIRDSGGFASLSRQIGTYGILYQTIIAVFTYFDYNCVYLYKMLSIAFDFALAGACSYGLCRLAGERYFSLRANLLYATVLFMPTVVLNSAYWGQCDSIYVTFVVLMLFLLYQEKYGAAFVFLGIAFAFKLQAGFLLPFLVAYYFYKKKFSIFMFGISAVVLWLSGIVAFVEGRGLLSPFTVYLDQVDYFGNMWLDFPSLWILVGDDYEALGTYAFLLALCICGVGFYGVLCGKKKLDTPEQYLNAAAWSVWSCVLFLPGMHDRYAYLLDIILLILCFIDVRYVKYVFVSVFLGLITYGHFLFGNDTVDQVHTLVYLGTWLHYSIFIVKKELAEGGQKCITKETKR